MLRPPARADLATRLGFLLTGLQDIMDRMPLDAVAVEDVFMDKHPRAALVLGHARGIGLALAAVRNIAVHEYPPAVIKRHVVGSGRATKGQIRTMVMAQLQLGDAPAEDEADALAVALTHLRMTNAVPNTAAPGHPSTTSAQQQWLQAIAAGKKGGRRR